MDSYNLFGDDGSGMLEGLTDLGGSDAFTGSSSTNVTVENKESSDTSYRQAFTQGSEKLASFGSTAGSGISSNAAGVGGAGPGASATEYHEYGGYGPRGRAPQPPLGPHHPPHHVHPAHPPHAYPGYHPTPDPMYAIPDHPGLGDMWSATAPGANRYSPITPGYRHGYEHQQKMHQYSQQGSALGSMQPQNGSYMPRQPHFPQPPAQQVYGQQQSYPSYTQMHPPSASRIPQHPSYHQQMEVNPHQYGLPHGQQSHGAVPQHQPHQSIPGHPPGIAAGLQSHPNTHPTHHHTGPPLHHMPRQPLPPSSGAPPSHAVPPQLPYTSPHHSVPMNYPHQAPHPLDVNVASQYNKPSGLETGSPQYRPPFPQLSPQVSPRAQMSPRQQPSQLSPRPVMSPVKGPSASPHGQRSIQPPVSSGAPPPTSSYTSQNTLQALEQMVLPSGAEYPYQRNQNSPAMVHLASSPSQWNPNKIPTPTPMNTVTHQDNEHATKSLESAQQHKLEPLKNIAKPTNAEHSTLDNTQPDSEGDNIMNQRTFMSPSSLTPTSASSISMLSSNMSQTNNSPGNVPPANISATSVSSVNLPPISTQSSTKENPVSNTPIAPSNESSNNEKSQAIENVHIQSEEIKSDTSASCATDKHDIGHVSKEQKLETKSAIESSNKNSNEQIKIPNSAASAMPESKSSLQQLTMPSNLRHPQSMMSTATSQFEHLNALNRNMPYQPTNMQTLMTPMRPPIMPHNLPVSIPSSVPNSAHNVHQNFPCGPSSVAQSVPNGLPSGQSHSMPLSNITTSMQSSVSHNQSNSMNLSGVPQNLNSVQGNIQSHAPPGMPTNIQHNSPSMPPNSTSNMPSNTSGIPSNAPPGISSNSTVGTQSGTQNMTPNCPPGINPNASGNIQSGTPNMPTSGPPGLCPNTPSGLPANTPGIPPNTPGMPASAAPGITSNIPPGIPPNTTAGMPPNVLPGMTNISMGMPLGGPNIHPPISNIQSNQNLPPSMQVNQTNIMPNMGHNPNIMVLGPNTMPHPNMPGMFPPTSHHQERIALQQQIQDIYCLPPSSENQEKVRFLQDRLSMLQQHETNDKCHGGPNCALQNPVYGTKMVESPQVTSTTGRGRAKGPAKPRKPRAKKEKIPPNLPPLDQLPVSEDCVTAGTGLQTSIEPDQQQQETDITDLDSSALSIDEFPPNIKGKRGPRGPRKPKERKPRAPKEPKNKDAVNKPVKERKKREPKDPNAPRKKRASKKDMAEIQADTTTTSSVYDFTEKDALCTTLDSSKNSLKDSSNKMDTSDMPSVDDSTVTDFDDIPVSKIAIKDLMEEAEAKREHIDIDDDLDSVTNKKKSKKRASSGGRKATLKRTPGGRRKKRGGIVPDSDGEPDDMMSTPPPSPPPEDDSLKRRSARNTQRKKYTDDVMLRLSDEEYAVPQTPKIDKISKNEDSNDVIIDPIIKLDGGTPKPNYMYVNTTDEDSMIVQHVLACRMGKREFKPEPPPPPPPASAELVEEEIGSENKSEVKKEEEIKESAESKNEPEKEIEHNELKDDDKDKIDDQIEECKEVKPKPVEVAETVSQDKSEISDIKQVDDKDKKPVMVDVEEYFVKYRNFSYLHCEWKTEEELYKGDKRIFSKIKRFKQKQAQQLNIFEMLDEEPFNPDYIEVERILDVSENQDPGNSTVVKHFLVKWKSLQYEDSTWELEEDIDVDKIEQFKIFNDTPQKEKWKYKKRPSADHWVQLKESPVYKGANTLRPYQLEGLNWLLFSWHNNRNCILADEMGLGKTIQSLTFVNAVWEYGIRGPFLIIAPLSTIPNWQREFEGWTDMNVIVYHGSQQSKSMIQEYEFYYKNEKGEAIKDITKFNVLITTFEIIVTDFQELKTFNWRVCVIDEAHRLKNRNCKLLEGLRQLHLEHRVLLSGTPLQNNVNELFSLLNFLEPTQFCSSEAFLNEFGQLRSESEVLKLQALLKPMMLRRLKEDVEKTLAPKEETIIEVELTNIQKKYYRAILERNFSFLQKGTASAANIPNLMNTMMELRKCCIHPYLLNGAEDQIQFDYKQVHGEDKEAYYKALIQSSGKMVLVDKLLPKLKAGGHRVLIFSQMVRCLDILEDYLMFRKYPFERIDGRIRGNLRQEAIDRFSKPDSDRFIFLLCTKAGGLGINLTAADTVIIYDSDWNPQNDLQAQARCHRIGQQKMVKIYRLICRNTYEREMFDKASLKLGLDKAILQSMNTSQGKETGLRQLSKKEIEDLLKKGAYGAVMDEDNAGDKFCEEDIEMILARRTQVIQMESEKGSTFSKASFAANDQRSDIDIRDPDFWNKWAKKADIDTTEKKEDEDLIVTEPRKRTVIKRYGHDDGPMEMSDEGTPESDEDEEGISLRSKRKKEKLGKKGRRYESDDYIPRHEGVPIDEEVVYGSWTRSECFKIERGLLTFGWARWDEILDKNQFRKGWTMDVIEDCARIIVLYCLRHYKGDEKIRNFIWDLIEPCENGEVTISRNHSGLHNPVPRGRNAKKKNRPKDIPKPSDVQKWEDLNHWSSTEKYDCEAYLESSYKKHLFRHANKVLLRVRMMYYIKHEVIGDYATQIESGVHASALGMRVPRGVDSAPPRLWWDSECDVSLLVGTYIHGYENYLAMRSDPQLCYVDKLGPPDDAECTDIKSEERKVRGGVGGEEECTDDVSSGAGATSPAGSVREEDAASHLWPSMQDLNTRLRRLITAYQRNYKREELKMQQRAKMERRDQLAREEASQWRWSRADEEAFRRTVASYGVEFDPATKSLRWNRFRALAKLESKSDDALTDYLKAFMAMCKRQCGLSVGEAELPTRPDLKAEPIGEERAIATLERIDLLRVLREEVAPHPLLEARLALCTRTPDAPPWWSPAAHDEPLVLHVCRHGLGDTYRKIFCDPKLPFGDCARKWLAKNKSVSKPDSNNGSSDDDEKKSEGGYETRKSLRRSKRTSHPERSQEEDTDALSELETLAKLGRAEESLTPDLWFSERALETRLHHIAHTVQNNEWPAHKPDPEDDERKASQKRHIAIDVETERAKLHALLSSPAGSSRDEEGPRRAAPAPPPAHQRPSPAPPATPPAATPPAPAAAPVDLSAPLDLSDAQDLSTRAPPPASSPAPTRSLLDETLSKLMKRKNVPAPEQIVGKEKKRKKLDEIVLGLSAAKGQTAPATSPAAAAVALSAADPRRATPPAPPPVPSQKPFSVTLTSVSSSQPPSTKELSSFLQQSLEQSSKATKSSSLASSSAAKMGYSHEAKVNKWLAEQARRTGAAGVGSSVGASVSAGAPRLSPDEHVPVVHRVTGKRIVGHKAPQLKHLAQWIAENPMYDIDPKWTEGIKEHVKLPQDVRSQRHSPMQSSGVMGERKKGRPPTLDSPSASALSSSAHLGQNLAGLNPALLASLSSLSAFDPKSLGAFDPKTLAATLSNLTGFDPKLLGSFDPKLLNSFDPKLLSSFDPKLISNLSNFDPKNNPLLSSFSNMPNLLGNIAGGNIFANLAGLGLPGFSSLDMNTLSGATTSGESKSKSSRKPESGSTNSKNSSQFPFVFPNPNMLYPQLGLSGLNPFGMHSGMTSAYDALGLLGNNLAVSSGSSLHSSHNPSRTSTKTTTPRTSTVVTNSSTSRQQKVTDRQQASQLPQIMLPPDPFLLESLSKQSLNYDALLKGEKRSRESEQDSVATDLSKSDKKKLPMDALRSQMPPEFAAVQEKLLKGDKKDIDISKMLLEQMASGALSASLVSSAESSKKTSSSEREAYDKMAKSSDYSMRAQEDNVSAMSNTSIGHKRTHEEMSNEPENLAMQTSDSNHAKKVKETLEVLAHGKNTDPPHTGEMDLEDLIAPSTVIKTGMKTSDIENVLSDTIVSQPVNLEREEMPQMKMTGLYHESRESIIENVQTTESGSKLSEEITLVDDSSNVEDLSNDNSRRATRKKGRKSSDESAVIGPRRELRSSGRHSTDTGN